ncbi:MAG: L-seryl-tRNA(Sec) selenium transferase [Chloroflexi bacterium 54-19]|nr:MAG: L-seryl-tRNA(Sec) selenium transferase [Chloroflexi bacterium 54-19]
MRNLPGVEKLLQTPVLRDLGQTAPHDLLVEAARQTLDETRQNIRQGQFLFTDLDLEVLAGEVARRVEQSLESSLREVINATGVILHTNLGRAPLSREAIAAVAASAGSYSNLEYDLESGERGSRLSHIESLLARLSGAEAAIAVNNNAAAVFMVLTAFAQGKEVILSRGQAVEIGGGFRIPDVMRQTGARLVEVGTTNKTYATDYESAVTPETAMLMRVHSSNFKIIGFTANPDLKELAEIAHRHNLLLVDDLGSGTLLDTARYGLTHEPTVGDSIRAGADIVTFSGDKLLGGPQAGLIAGKKEYIARLRKHPLARALRLDKMTLAALQATLQHYLRDEAERKIPVWQMLSRQPGDLREQAGRWQARLERVWPGATIVQGESTIGGGSLPGETLPTWLLALPVPPDSSINRLQAELRSQRPPVIGRVEHDCLLFDPRTVLDFQEETLLATLEHLASQDSQ